MPQKPKKRYQSGLIMTLYPNALGFGFAIMKDAVTVEMAQVVAVKPRPISNAKALERIREKVAYYEPDTIVIEDYQKAKKSARVSKLLKAIADFAKQRNINFYTYSRTDIRFAFSNFNAHTKHEIAKVISENVPYMKDRQIEKRKCFESEAYPMGAFDAVSLGITHFYMID
jgi:Holliday junction resolvasome RuvABC endonuclease subunit